MEELEKTAKQTVLKNISQFMKKMTAEKLKPKKEEKKEEKEEDTEITPELLEKLKALHASKEE